MRRPIAIGFASALVFLSAFSVFGGEAILLPRTGPFVVGGKRRAAAIVVERPLPRGHRNAPNDLARYLERITGAPGPVVVSVDAVRGPGIRIHVGRSRYVDRQALDLDGLHIDGYIIKLIDEDNLAIVGGEHLGTGIGVYDFLKKVCGCRWFMPGPLGEVIPSREEIALDGLAIRSEPSIHSVWIRPVPIDNLKLKHFRRYHWAGHNLKRLVPPREYADTHPEYYPYVGNRRLVPSEGRTFPWQPCVSNPDLPALVVDAAREHFAKQPHSRVFSMGVNDGGGDCLCEKCRQQDAIEHGVRSMSDRYARFYNRCAERFEMAFPDKLLGFIAYGGIRTPPRNVEFRDNVYVRMGGRANVIDDFEAWAGAVKRLGIYEYLYGTHILEPRHYPRVLGDYVKLLKSKYDIQSFSAEASPFWPFDAPKLYVLHELVWDIDRDVDRLLEDYFSSFYGAAAQPMSDFFQRMEDVYRRREDVFHFFAGFRRGGFQGWTLEDLSYMDSRIAKAKASAGDDVVSERVKIVGDAYEHVKCWLRVAAHTDLVRSAEATTLADADKIVSHARAIFRSMQERTEWDAKVKDPSRYPSAEYHRFYVPTHYADPGPLVQTDPEAELAVEEAFGRVSQALNEDAGRFWESVAEEDAGRTRLTLLAKTQLYLRQRSEDLENLIANGDFENVAEGRRPMDDRLLKEHRWERVRDVPSGFAVWSYTGRPAKFVWTDKLAYSGKRCIGIENNEVRASFIRHLAVKPAERYLVSVAATRLWEGDARDVTPELTVAWQGRRDGRSYWTKAPRIARGIDVESSGRWQEASVRVTVPEDATAMVLMLGVSGSQVGGGGTYFDDLRVVRIYANP